MRTPSPEEMAVFRQTLNQRQAQTEQALRQRYGLAQQTVEAATQLLKQEFSANPVILFGSLLDQSRFHLTSDLDLAVGGLPPLDYFIAVAKLQDLSPFKIDLVQIDHCKPSLKAAILEQGKVL